MENAKRILDALGVAVVIQDASFRITYANARATSLLGLTVEEIRSRTTDDARWDVIDASGRPVVGEGHPAVRAMRTGSPVRDVLLGVRREGSSERTWILASAMPETGPDGVPVSVLVTFSDVNVPYRAFRESDATYRSVFRSTSEGIVVHDPDGSIRTANAAAERVLGLTVDQMSGRAATDPRWRLVTADGRGVTPDDIPSELALKSGQPTDDRILGVHRPGGQIAWLSVRADPLREPGDDTLKGVVATFTDITRERETTLALEASRAQVQRVLDAVPGVVYQYLRPKQGPDRFVFVGGRIREVLGLDPVELKARPDTMYSLLNPEARDALLSRIDSTVTQGQVFEYEVPAEIPGAGTRWLKVHGVPEATEDGVLYTGVITDVTEAHRLSEVLRKTQRREAMGEMAAGIAHNFNNTLAVILPNLQMARDDRGLSPDTLALLASAERAAHSAADLVQRMLSLARPEHVDSTAASFDLASIAREAVHICRQTFDRHIRIDFTAPSNPTYVRGRLGELQQVVLNLCLNARDALLDSRDPVIGVHLTTDDMLVRLDVVDNGQGMPEEVLRRVGEPFFSTKGPGRGTGLGVASAIASVSEVGGRWSVESAPGKGTTFSLRWPRAKPPEVIVPEAERTPVPQGIGTVLVIDDEPFVRDAIAWSLERAGHRTVTCGSAQEALDRLRGPGIPDLRAILFDLSMPGMSGAQAFPLLQAAAPGVPCLVLSGHVPGSTVLTGAAAILQKPLGKDALVEAVRRAITQARDATHRKS